MTGICMSISTIVKSPLSTESTPMAPFSAVLTVAPARSEKQAHQPAIGFHVVDDQNPHAIEAGLLRTAPAGFPAAIGVAGMSDMWTSYRSPGSIVAVKTLPWPTKLVKVRPPPSDSAILRQIARPSPVPPCLRVTEVSHCTKG